jgi:FkbM family methyltransferase
MNLFRTLKKAIKPAAKRFLKKNESRISYSQEGEDVLLDRIIGNIKYSGSFVDIGAFHPIKFSNTYKFYRAGWRGINVEATPGRIAQFRKLRPQDINLEMPVSDKEESMPFYIFNYPELNTFSEAHVKEWDGKGNVRLVETVQLKAVTISKILQQYLPNKTSFDLLSIDVEGMDLRILQTIDFNTYRFKYIIAEDEPGDVTNAVNGPISNLLYSKGYKMISKLYYSNLYALNEA